MGAEVKVGTFGDIKKMMKLLSKRDLHTDLEFVCGMEQNRLPCHRFIIGAQSKFLKSLLEMSHNGEGQLCQIFLPDVEKSQMEVVLQFLYTGRLKLSKNKEIFTPLWELLFKVLRIDADFKFPCEDIFGPNSSTDSSKKDHDDSSGGHSTRPSPSYTDTNAPGQPPKKRFRPNPENRTPNGDRVEDRSSAAMSPPHELETEPFDDEDIRVITPPPKATPQLVDLSDNEENVESQNQKPSQEDPKEKGNDSSNEVQPATNDTEEALDDNETDPQALFDSLHLAPAPKIIAKHTGRIGPKPNESQSQSQPIPDAPKIVTKKTGKRGRPQGRRNSKTNGNITEAQPSTSSEVRRASSASEINELNTEVEIDTSPLREGPSTPAEDCQPQHGRSTRSATGSLRRRNFSELFNLDSDEEYQDPDLDDADFEEPPELQHSNLTFSPPILPPPLPQAPEAGLVLYRGQWMKQAKVDRIKARREMINSSRSQKVRKYNPSTESITGKTMPGVEKYRSEPEGRHECPQCGAVFAVSRSLEVHMMRSHNPNANIECPEGCGKKFTNRAAIRKHLLSHRPESEWPYICLFCKKRFQARADLPKHFKTSKHINDPNIPKQGTPAWIELMQRSEIIPWSALKMKFDVSLNNIAAPIWNPAIPRPTLPELRPVSPATNNPESRASSPNSMRPEIPSPVPTLSQDMDDISVISPSDAAFVASAVATDLSPEISAPNSGSAQSNGNVQDETNQPSSSTSEKAMEGTSSKLDESIDEDIPDFEVEDEFAND